MSKSLIHVVNTSTQAVSPTATSPAMVSLGNAIRRYGCNLHLNGNSIEQIGGGYFELDGSITVAPTTAGVVTVALFKDGEILAGSQVSGSVSTAGNPVTLPLIGTARNSGCCNASSITVGVIAGVGDVTNVTLRDVKS